MKSDAPGVLAADVMGVAKTFTSVAAPMIYKSLTRNVFMGLPPSMLWGNTLQEWVQTA